MESRLYGSWIADRDAKPAGPAPMMQMSYFFIVLLQVLCDVSNSVIYYELTSDGSLMWMVVHLLMIDDDEENLLVVCLVCRKNIKMNVALFTSFFETPF